jgi:hypothetical protein
MQFYWCGADKVKEWNVVLNEYENWISLIVTLRVAISSRKDWGKTRKSSVRVAGCRTEIRIQDFPKRDASVNPHAAKFGRQ